MRKKERGTAFSPRDVVFANGGLNNFAKSAAFFLLALVLGELSNFLTLEILPGSFFWFKMTAYLVVAARLGPVPGLALAAILFADIGADVNNLYILVVYCLESLVVGLGRFRHPKRSIVSIVALFWPFVGLPLLGLMYALFLGLSREALVLSLLKVWLNAFFDAALAGMLADSRLADRLLGNRAEARATRSIEKYLKVGVGIFVLPVTFLVMIVGLSAFRSNTENDIAFRVRSGVSRASAFLKAHDNVVDPSIATAELNNALSETSLDPEGRYELASSDYPSFPYRPWREGLFVRSPEDDQHPIDRWRLSEYYGEVSVNGMTLRYVVSFGSVFRELYRLYAMDLAICVAFLNIAYGLTLFVSRALAGRFAVLTAAANRLPERIEAGEEPSWPALDIDELSSLSDEFQTVSIRLRSLFSDLRDSRERLEETVAERTAELERRTEEVRLLLARVEREREEERSRIARELHDELGQGIASLGMALYLLERRAVDLDERAAEKIADMRELLAGLSDNMRRLIADLRPSILDRLGLPEALASLVKERAARSGLRIEFSCAVPEGFAPPEGPKIALYRIAQEALSNAIRHSGATWMGLSLRADEREMALEVRDSGKGFDADAAAPGLPRSFGLIGMRERCRALGGDFVVSSVIGSGTLVSAIIPIGEYA
jgi:signal transduction histidine kinase